jgi:type IV pilus assembly protein PilZ
MGAKAKGDVIEPVPVSISDAERRRAPRVLLNLEVDYASEDNYLFAYITDISETGIFIRTTTPEEPGTLLNLRFTPPCEDDADFDPEVDADDEDAIAARAPFELEGEVIWVNPFRPDARDNLHPGMGVRFRGLDAETKHRLMELVRRIAYLT